MSCHGYYPVITRLFMGKTTGCGAGGGCGALLSDAEAFAKHCGEVEHDDDFAYVTRREWKKNMEVLGRMGYGSNWK